MANTTSKSLSEKTLSSLYKEQWTQIRHLDNLDIRTFYIIPPVFGILTFALSLIPETEKASLLVSISTIQIGLACLGIYTVVRNWICYGRRLVILGEIERELGLVEKGIVMEPIQYVPPATFLGFLKRLGFSIRGILMLFYTALSYGGLSLTLTHGKSIGFQTGSFILKWGPFNLNEVVIISLILSLLLTFLLIYWNYLSVSKENTAVRRELELRRGQREAAVRGIKSSPAEDKIKLSNDYYLLGIDYVEMNPPRIDRAIQYFKRSLDLNPKNKKTMDSLNKLGEST